MAKGLVDRDFLWRLAAFDLACEDLTDFGNDVFIADQARRLGSQKLRALVQNTFTAIGKETRAEDQGVVDFGRSRVAGSD